MQICCIQKSWGARQGVAQRPELGNKLGLDEKQDELLRKSGLDKQIDLEKFDPKKLFPKKKIDFKKLFD